MRGGGECDSVDTVSVAMTSDESSAETLVSDEDNSSQFNDGEEDGEDDEEEDDEEDDEEEVGFRAGDPHEPVLTPDR